MRILPAGSIHQSEGLPLNLQRGQLVFSATDLTQFLECEHLTALDLRALRDPDLRRRKGEADESTQLIQKKGIEHEQAYLAKLVAAGRQVVDIVQACGGDREAMADSTRVALRDGIEVIYQAALEDGALAGYADFLLRVGPAPGGRGWLYEAADTKLARTAKAKSLVQLAFYSRLLERAQGHLPAHMHVVLGDQSAPSFRSLDHVHYFDALLARLRAEVERLEAGGEPAYPLPCAHCAMCGWRPVCEARREADDHLSQVANITRSQIAKLEAAGVATLAGLAAVPADAALPRLVPETLERLRGQARLQFQARQTDKRIHELLPVVEGSGRGFLRLPAPDAGDLFFDMEGSPLDDGGLEYLFGVWFHDGGAWAFKGFWAHDRRAERQAFEDFIDFVMARRRAHPGAHVYHYASYEETALKRLARVHASREVELDTLLREGALVDLYKVVREGLRISEPSYSIKYVEHFYRGARSGDVKNAGASIVYYERWRETGDDALLKEIEAYNRDDVESTWQLRDWLLTLRPAGLPWRTRGSEASPDAPAPDAAAFLTPAQEAEQRLVPYRVALVDGLSADRTAWTPAEQLSELVYLLLDFHRRADKPQWWALFDRMEQPEEQWLDDADCLAGLTLDLQMPPYKAAQSTVYTYEVPPQETKLADGAACTRCDTGQALGKLSYDPEAGRAALKVGPGKAPLPPRLSIGPTGPMDAGVMVRALHRFADSYLAGDGRYRAAQALLRRDLPRFRGRAPGQPVIAPGQDLTAGAVAAARDLDDSYLYVQGPPGAGKTYTGARMIAALLGAGKRVGILSNSHKAINHLMAEAMAQVNRLGLDIRAVKKASRDNPDSQMEGLGLGVHDVYLNKDAWASPPDLLGGTAWLFADPALDGYLDALFIDEAGQVALANLVAASTSARNLILLGDQMQLAQPVQGVHPGRSGDSALDYLLDGAATIAPERGIFLASSWRMHPAVCGFISDAVYDGRLQSAPGNEARTLVLDAHAHRLLQPVGLVHAAVDHSGCSQSSRAEADLIVELYRSALGQRFTDRDGQVHPMGADHILVVAPYNAQVNLLRRLLPDDARVGTVDKFQGQEAELVLVSMTTSSEQELPRDIEFLYSKNRLNVAISRAKCLAVVVANPRLFSIRCETPQQMRLVNLLAWAARHGAASGGA